MRYKVVMMVAGALALAACGGQKGAPAGEAPAETLGTTLARDYPQGFEKWQGYVDRSNVYDKAWIKTLDVNAGPLVEVTAGGTPYLKGFACETGETSCAENKVLFFISPDQSRVFGFGKIVTPEGHSIERMIGAANGEELRCLRFFMDDTSGATTC